MATKLTDYDYAMKHKYRVESGGVFVPGVTTILNIIDKPALKWTASEIAAQTAVANSRRKKTIVKNHRIKLASYKGNQSSAVKCRRLAAEGTDDEVFVHFCRGEFDRQWREKANRGNRVHDVAERWTRKETVDVRDDESGWIDALENFHKLFKPKFLLTECIVTYDPKLSNPGPGFDPLALLLPHGGRFDHISELDYEGSEGTFLCDYKTGSYEDEYGVAVQAIGYMIARLVTFLSDGSLGETKPLPKLDGARTIYLRGDGTVKVSDPFAKITKEQAFRAFKASRELFEILGIINSTLEMEIDE